MNNSENQKFALVTGSRRGIGKAIGLALLKEGYFVIFNGVSQDLPDNLIREIEKISKKYEYIQCDIGNSNSRQNFVDVLIKKYPRLDLLVNNAGIAPKVRVDLLETDPEDYQRVMDVNLNGTFFLTIGIVKNIILEFSKTLPEIDFSDYHPIIINISSISAYTSSINRPAYCISKAGMSMMTNLLADRLVEENILVYEIRPGIIKTDMTKKVTEKYDKLISEGLTPMKRWGLPEDCAEAVLLLSIGKLRFSTGEIINIDGGFHIKRL
ncbi:MAG: 3-ketoacyl-ACP reductase [archaeon]|nr:3-ketoacyl-ACP reductase [archaeon]